MSVVEQYFDAIAPRDVEAMAARDSIRKLAALDLSAAWPGHADPLTGDVRAQLELAASA